MIDGNKRVGTNAAGTSLLIDDWRLAFSEGEYADLVLPVAAGVTSKAKLTEIFELRGEPVNFPLK